MSDRISKGLRVAKVQAIDSDLGDNAKVTYAIRSVEREDNWPSAFEGRGGDDDIDARRSTTPVTMTDLLRMSAQTGEIVATRSFSGLHATRLQMTVSASDRGTPPKTTFASLILVINSSAPLQQDQSSFSDIFDPFFLQNNNNNNINNADDNSEDHRDSSSNHKSGHRMAHSLLATVILAGSISAVAVLFLLVVSIIRGIKRRKQREKSRLEALKSLTDSGNILSGSLACRSDDELSKLSLSDKFDNDYVPVTTNKQLLSAATGLKSLDELQAATVSDCNFNRFESVDAQKQQKQLIKHNNIQQHQQKIPISSSSHHHHHQHHHGHRHGHGRAETDFIQLCADQKEEVGS